MDKKEIGIGSPNHQNTSLLCLASQLKPRTCLLQNHSLTFPPRDIPCCRMNVIDIWLEPSFMILHVQSVIWWITTLVSDSISMEVHPFCLANFIPNKMACASKIFGHLHLSQWLNPSHLVPLILVWSSP